MDCPVCLIPLIVVERNQVELDWCFQCKGFWFDESELELLLQNLDISAEIPDFFQLPAKGLSKPIRRCPRCRKKMETITLPFTPPLDIDRCPDHHGIWLDAGELGRIVQGYATSSGKANPVLQFLGETFAIGG